MSSFLQEDPSQILSKVNASRNFICNTTEVIKIRIINGTQRMVYLGSELNQQIGTWLKILPVIVGNPVYFLVPIISNFFVHLWKKLADIYRGVFLTYHGVLNYTIYRYLKVGGFLFLFFLMVNFRSLIWKSLVEWMKQRDPRWMRWVPVQLRNQFPVVSQREQEENE